MRFGIRAKFVLLVGALLLAIFASITVFQIHNNTKTLRAELFNQSRAFASLATPPIGNVFAIYKDSGTSKISQEVNKFTKLNDSITNVAVIDITGKEMYSQHPGANLGINSKTASTFDPIYQNSDNGALNTIIYPYFEASGSHRFSVVYSVSDNAIERAVRQEAMSLLYFGLVSLAATMLLTYLLINQLIIKRIRVVDEQAGVISSGNLEQEIIMSGGDEIASLGDSVNKMADSLKADIAKLKEVDKVKSEFMMITSHNLRTPLSIINGYLENTNLFKDVASLQNALGKIGASVKRLDVFAEDILTISQFELGNQSLQLEEIGIREFVQRMVTEFEPTAALKELTLSSDIAPIDTKVRVSPPHLRSAVWNVLDNAVKFTDKGGTITVTMTYQADGIHIAISDTGIGIAAAEMPKLFTKFHRGTSTLSYDYEGTGIGLYSSKMIIERQGGTITAQSQEGQGSTFTIILPAITRVL